MDSKDSIFEEEIIEGLKDIIPPENEIQNINPWGKPINSITWGLILTMVKLNFLFLQYILPTIGIALIFLGFRSLRNQNKYFKLLYIMSIVKLVSHMLDIIIVTTPLNTLSYPVFTIGLVTTVFQIFIFLIFHKGLKAVHIKAGKTMKSSPLLWAALWIGLVFLLAITPLSETWLVFIPMIIFYILIIRSISSIGKQLDDTGYLLINAPVKINNRTIGRMYFLLIMIIGVSGNMYLNNLKLESSIFVHPDNSSLREDFLAMGFPEEALRYLSDSDIDLLKEAVHVEVENEVLMFDPKEIEHIEKIREDYKVRSYTNQPGKKNIDASTIYIEMPEKTLYVMNYFKWSGGNPIWQDGIMITGNPGLANREIINGGLFYSKNDREYIADFPHLSMEGVERHTFFRTDWTEPIRGAFSFPIGSEGQGGYVLYRYGTMEDNRYLIPSLFEYLHQSNPIRIPYVRAE
ncbi:MAG: hypothetical protein GX053_09875, partial [Tissierella sp.]|nr:hypothetical protein [Tissierella sp.]